MSNKIGDRVKLISMPNETKPKAGDEGTVTHVDAIHQVHVSWDCGSSLALIPGEDTWETIYES